MNSKSAFGVAMRIIPVYAPLMSTDFQLLLIGSTSMELVVISGMFISVGCEFLTRVDPITSIVICQPFNIIRPQVFTDNSYVGKYIRFASSITIPFFGGSGHDTVFYPTTVKHCKNPVHVSDYNLGRTPDEPNCVIITIPSGLPKSIFSRASHPCSRVTSKCTS